MSDSITSYYPKGINAAPWSVTDFDACSPAIQCHADKFGARIFEFEELLQTIRVLAFDEQEALKLAQPIIAEIRHAVQLEVAFDEDTEIECWCGAKGKASELYDETGLDDGCGGLGILHCYCGGDLCVCHHHGETECLGCPDCEDHEDDDWSDE